MKRTSILIAISLIFQMGMNSAHATWTIQPIEDLSGNPGFANVETTLETPYENSRTQSLTAVSKINGKSATWMAENCVENGTRCAYISMFQKTSTNVTPSISPPGFRFATVKLLYKDGTPMKHVEVNIENDINATYCNPPIIGTGNCRWVPGLTSSVLDVSPNSNTKHVFTDDQGQVTVITLQTADSSHADASLTVTYYRDNNYKNALNESKQFNLATIQDGEVFQYKIDTPEVAIQNKLLEIAAKSCSLETAVSPIPQFPKCEEFTQLGEGIGYDPLPYRENTAESLITLSKKINPLEFNITSITPTICENPRIDSINNLRDKDKTYIYFDAKSSGMCRINLIRKSDSSLSRIEAPVHSWQVSVSQQYLRLDGPGNYGKVPIGTIKKIGAPYFYYPADRRTTDGFIFDMVAPVTLENLTPMVCQEKTQYEFQAIKGGECRVKISYKSFAISSLYFPGRESSFVIFTAQTVDEINADKAVAAAAAAARKAEAIKAADKAKADAKLCKPELQAALKRFYKPMKDFNDSYAQYFQKATRVDYLISQVGKNQDIQVPESEFPSILSTYPAIYGIRQVPLYVYKAVLQGTLMGIKNNYTLALNDATIAYKAATPGCKKVVGPPK